MKKSKKINTKKPFKNKCLVEEIQKYESTNSEILEPAYDESTPDFNDKEIINTDSEEEIKDRESVMIREEFDLKPEKPVRSRARSA